MLKILEYFIYYIFYYILEDSDDTIWYIVNFVVCAVCDFLIMHCVMAVLPVEPKSKSGDSSPPGEMFEGDARERADGIRSSTGIRVGNAVG
jgi:hypothetical protein